MNDLTGSSERGGRSKSGRGRSMPPRCRCRRGSTRGSLSPHGGPPPARGTAASSLPWLLLVGVLALLCAHAARREWPTSAGAGDAPELDSFAAPDIAAAVLQRHAQDLVSASAANRDELYAPAALGGTRTGISQGLTKREVAGADSVETTPPAAEVWVERLRQEIYRLDTAVAAEDLHRELLLLSEENGLWTEFLDTYLAILAREPGSSTAISWARLALVYAQRCQRLEEVRDALDHQARYYRVPKVAARFKAVLEEWDTERREGRSDLSSS